MRRAVSAAAVALILVGGVASPAAADLEGDLAEVERRIDAYKAELAGVSEERSEIAGTLLETDARLDELAGRYAEARAELGAVDAEIDAIESEISSLQSLTDQRNAHLVDLRQRVERVKAQALERAVELYMAPWPGEQGSSETNLDAESAVALAYADRVQQIADRDIATLEFLRAEERRALARLEEDRVALEARSAEREDARALRDLAAERVADQQAEVEEQLAAQQAILAEIDAQISEIEGEIAGLAAEEGRIRTLIAQEQIRAGTRPGILVRPVVPGGVSSGYGYRIHPIYGVSRLHTGLDMDAGCGQPIMAAEAGRVFLAGWRGGYGIAVMIDHGGGMSTLYGHLTSAAVSYGQRVGAGQVIGYGGTTGVSTSCHLHFEVRLGGSPVDPAPYL